MIEKRITTHYIIGRKQFSSICHVFILPTGGLKWIFPKEFHMTKHTRNTSKGCVLEVNLKYPKKNKRIT